MKKSTFKISITGSSGFIGSKLIRELSRDNKFILKTHFNNDSSIKTRYKNISILPFFGSLLQIKNLFNLSSDSDILIHLAFDRKTILNNKIIANNIVQVLNSNKKLKLIYLSTADIFEGKNSKINDNDIPQPISHYSKVKYDLEKIFRGSDSRNRIKILRVSEVFGRGGIGLNSHINRCKSWPIWLINIFLLIKKNNFISYIASNDLIRIIEFCILNFEKINHISLITDNRDNRNNYILLYEFILKNMNNKRSLNLKNNSSTLISKNKYKCSDKLRNVLDQKDSYWQEVMEIIKYS